MATLAVKLGTLVVKQLSKPVAKQLAGFILSHDGLRKGTINMARVRIYAACSARDPFMLHCLMLWHNSHHTPRSSAQLRGIAWLSMPCTWSHAARRNGELGHVLSL